MMSWALSGNIANQEQEEGKEEEGQEQQTTED